MEASVATNRRVEGQLKLSELKPCAKCGGPLRKPPSIQWYVVRMCHAMLNPRATNEVLGLAQYFQGRARDRRGHGARRQAGLHPGRLRSRPDERSSPAFDAIRQLLEKE
jgi:hypothetical protein